ncbi:MAG: hypothetical protein L6R41_004453, partial [Letrouitia leprolyta]
MAGREASLRGSITFSLIAFVQMADYQQFYLYKNLEGRHPGLIWRISKTLLTAKHATHKHHHNRTRHFLFLFFLPPLRNQTPRRPPPHRAQSPPGGDAILIMCLGHEVEDLETSNKSAAEQLVLQSSGPQASDPTPPHVIIRLGSAVKLAASLSTHLFEVYKKAVQENAERTKDFEDLKDQYQMKLSQKQCIIISQKMPIAR